MLVLASLAFVLTAGRVTEGSTVARPAVGAHAPSAVASLYAPPTTRDWGTSEQHVSDASVPRAILVGRGQPLTVERDAQDVELAIIEAAREFGADPQQLLRVARCESGLSMEAAGADGEIGAFQFRARTFKANAARLGYRLADITDAIAQSRTAAMMFASGQEGQWTCR